MPVIGFLGAVSPGAFSRQVAAFRQGLTETDYREGQNVVIQFRWAEGNYERLPTLAADLVREQPSVIVAASPPSALAAKAATNTIPIVFSSGDDPVKSGLAASLSKPGGNATGVSPITYVLDRKRLEIDRKRLEMLHKVVPNVSAIAVLMYAGGSNPRRSCLNYRRQRGCLDTTYGAP